MLDVQHIEISAYMDKVKYCFQALEDHTAAALKVEYMNFKAAAM